MRVEYEPSGLSAVQNLGLDAIAFANAVQAWVNVNKENINPQGGNAQIPYLGHNYTVTYTVNNDMTVFFIVNVQF
ncbi:hypothetical protein [Ciceribacter ferrooxidans]|uniref:Uncharacterized protein n=1 Tax=Ciceribacter ferrooxidans TaxID=2509717 RepID=A0A4V1RQA1_9HYPH|nr:hypothetical protein [Ciceribacter ferrooxidans]RYC12137.1 hypothetical protein EUU22_13850 [Ciceribacter ferrooxidans]